MKDILKVLQLTKSFGQFLAVNHVSFSIPKGAIVGLLGPNGAGKTTIIQMLLGLMTPTEGEIFYFNTSLAKEREKILGKINHCSGYGKLPGKLLVEENLTVYKWIYSIKNFKEKLASLSNRLEARHLLSKKTQDLSSGEMTKIMLIKAFLNDPELILLDEPTASLDPDSAVTIREFILEEKKKRNLTLLITSHNMEEMEELCDQIIFLHQGKVLTIDTPQNLAKTKQESQLLLLISSGEHLFQDLLKKHHLVCKKRKNKHIVLIPETLVASFLSDLGKQGIEYSEIEIIPPSLEDFFLATIKKGSVHAMA